MKNTRTVLDANQMIQKDIGRYQLLPSSQLTVGPNAFNTLVWAIRDLRRLD